MDCVFWNYWLCLLFERTTLDWFYITFRRFRRIYLAYYVSLTIFINHLMMASRQQASFLIYQRHLINFGTRVFSSSWSKMVYQVTFQMLLPIFCIRENKELPWTIILSDLCQWLIWSLDFKSKIICGWHRTVFRCSKYKLNRKWFEQLFDENKWLGFSMESEIQPWP